MNKVNIENISEKISETLLIPLYCRAFETKAKNPIIKDLKAVEIVDKLSQRFH